MVVGGLISEDEGVRTKWANKGLVVDLAEIKNAESTPPSFDVIDCQSILDSVEELLSDYELLLRDVNMPDKFKDDSKKLAKKRNRQEVEEVENVELRQVGEFLKNRKLSNIFDQVLSLKNTQTDNE